MEKVWKCRYARCLSLADGCVAARVRTRRSRRADAGEYLNSPADTAPPELRTDIHLPIEA